MISVLSQKLSRNYFNYKIFLIAFLTRCFVERERERKEKKERRRKERKLKQETIHLV